MDTDSPIRSLRLAVESLGSQTAMSSLLGVSQQAISKWLAKEQPVPPKHVLTIERETGISRHDLRPDIYPRDDAPVSAKRAAESLPDQIERLARENAPAVARAGQVR